MAKKKANKMVVNTAKKVFVNPDEELAYHLKHAEEHLIKAVELFFREHKPERHKDFVERLTRAQETVTWLFREELIRIRGPIKVKLKK
jgi:hypothetical protein